MCAFNHLFPTHETTALEFVKGKMQLRANISARLKVDNTGAAAAAAGAGFGGLLYGDGCDGCYRKSPRIAGNLQGPWIKNWQVRDDDE